MPKIETLEVFGFKSFADKTGVHFDSGVTAIVGPNGCGKSNIADAINWVVGEQSAKSLRADRMEDVIFNGTNKRKSLSYTEVSLQLKDFERIIPAGDNTPEVRTLEPVSVTRRMYRSGESEYYISDKRCRLKDIYELLEGTGLGHNSYAIIEQGRIDQILSAKPQERRALIEEAAKVSVFKTRKKAAEVKLEMAQQNLARVNDIVVEVQRQANSLRRQAAKARRFGRLREELRQLQRARFYLEFTQFTEKLDQLNRELEGLHAQDRDLHQQSRQKESERQRLQENLDQMQRRIQSLLELLSRLDVDVERIDQQTRFQGQQIEEAQRRMEEARERALATRQKLADAAEAHQARLLLQAEARQGLDAGQNQVEQLKGRVEEVQRRIDEAQEQMEKIRLNASSHAGQLAQLRSSLARLEENSANLERQRGRVRLEQQQVSTEREVLEEKIRSGNTQFEQASLQGQVLQEQTAELKEQLAVWLADQESSQQELAVLNEQGSMLRHRLTSLEEIEFHHSNYAEGLQVYLNAVRDTRSQSPRTVADLVEATPQYETIIEDHLNEQLQYVVVDNIQEAVSGVELVKEFKAGKCSFISLAGTNGHGKREVIRPDWIPVQDDAVLGLLQDQLRMQPQLGDALRRVFPDLPSTYIVQDMDAAIRLTHQYPDTAFLTLSGEFMSARGFITASGERKGAVGLLSLRREKKELQEKLNRLEEKIEESRAANTLARARLRDGQQAIAQLQEEGHQADLEKARLEQNIASLRQALEKVESALAAGIREDRRFESEQAALQQQMQRLLSEMEEVETSSLTSESTIADLSMRIAEEQQMKETLALELAEARMEIATFQERAANLEKECARHARQQEELESHYLQAEREATDSAAAIRQLTESNRDLSQELVQLRAQRQTQGANLQNQQAAQQQAREQVAAFEGELEALRAGRDEVRQAISDHDVDRARCETELEALNRATIEEFHLPIQELAATFDAASLTLSPEEVQSRYVELRSRVEDFGPVNMGALEEYEEHEKRLQFLLSQQADIRNSIATTQQTIEEINRHSIQQFRSAFTEINKNFVEVFNLLFSGGHAEMRLIDDQDPMESGIEINASPPGKRLQNVMLLSGGEKALTALALLMGIFRFRPAPFCVLDEVDAPLDDANVQRFTKMLTQMSGHTQFIVITHNKRTLEAAQYMYGVTMQEAGVSRIVSVRFN